MPTSIIFKDHANNELWSGEIGDETAKLVRDSLKPKVELTWEGTPYVVEARGETETGGFQLRLREKAFVRFSVRYR